MARVFWDFAVAIYERPGVALACLALQDELGLDVNVILFCLWLGDAGHDLGPVLDRALDISRRWQAVIAPLRGSRRALKALAGENDSGLKGLRHRIQDCELEAERGEIDALADLAAGGHARVAAATAVAASNLRQYFSAMNCAADLLGRSEVLRILAAAFELPAHATPLSGTL